MAGTVAGMSSAMTTTIRVTHQTRDRLAAIAESKGQPMTAVVEQALDALERREFLEAGNRRYAELRADPEAWAEIQAERVEWENARRGRRR